MVYTQHYAHNDDTLDDAADDVRQSETEMAFHEAADQVTVAVTRQ